LSTNTCTTVAIGSSQHSIPTPIDESSPTTSDADSALDAQGVALPTSSDEDTTHATQVVGGGGGDGTQVSNA
jgi:hypothetical protein